MKHKELTRRDFIRKAAFSGAGLAVGSSLLAKLNALAQDPKIYLPLVLKSWESPPPAPTAIPTPTATPTVTPTTEPGTGPKVVHIRDADATDWNGSDWYGDSVNQSVVDTMVEEGLKALTGTSTVADAWNELLPNYQPGQKIAIKVNFNNSDRNGGCSATGNRIDALPQPVLALVKSLIGGLDVAPAHIWVYDATKSWGRYIPDRFRAPICALYPDVQFFGDGECNGVNQVSFDHIDDSLRVTFSDPQGILGDRWLPDLLYQASYLINMPILKRHGFHPVTLSFKNHFGSLDRISRGADTLHPFITPSEDLYDPNYSPLVDIYLNHNIRDKTVLTIGDGLYGAPGATSQTPTSWPNTFHDAPNSLFFSADPVAIDCVMCDFLDAEWGINDAAYDYLFIAQDAGLGVCEGDRSNPGGDPWGSGYSQIDYMRIDP